MSRRIRKGSFLLVLALAWPTMLEQLMQTAVQYVDTAMVGTLGRSATAAVGATTTIGWLINNTVSAIGIGFLAYISQAIGRGEEKNARRASAQSVLCVLVVGLVATALTLGLSGVIPSMMQVDAAIKQAASQYFFLLYTTMLFRTASIIFGTVLRAAGDTRTPMLVGIAVNVGNIILNYFLIYPTRQVGLFGLSFTMGGAGWGINGAAVASAVAYALGGIAITAALWRHKRISPKGESIKPDRSVLAPCLKVSFPNLLQRFATSFGYVVFASMINSLGEVATAAHTVANTVESAFYIPGWGMQTAAATLSGNAWGEKDDEKLQSITRATCIIEFILMVLSGGVLFLFAPQLAALFSQDAEVIALSTTVLRMVALSEPFYGIAIVLEGVMQGVGNTVLPFVFNVIGMWAVRIAGTFLCTHILTYGLIGAWASMIAHNVLLFVLFGIFFLTGKWKPKREPSEPTQESPV